MRLRAAVLLLALSTTLLSACGKSVGEGSKRLAVEAPRWWFSHLPVAVEVTPSGLLEEHEVTLAVSVGSNLAGRWELKGEPETIRIPGSYFSPGRNRIAVKSGSERTVVDVAVVSVVWLLAIIVLGLALAGTLFTRWRRRRGASPGNA